MPGSKFYCTMIPRKGNRKDANTEVYDRVRGNRNSQSERASGYRYVCGVSGVQNTRRRTGKRELLSEYTCAPGPRRTRVVHSVGVADGGGNQGGGKVLLFDGVDKVR